MVTILSRGSQGLFKYELIVFRKGLEVLVSIKVEIEALTFGTELGEERNSTWGGKESAQRQRLVLSL